jgi:hypothetical protein
MVSLVEVRRLSLSQLANRWRRPHSTMITDARLAGTASLAAQCLVWSSSGQPRSCEDPPDIASSGPAHYKRGARTVG